MEAIIF